MNQDPRPHFDWSFWLCPGPRRRFTPEEMRRGGSQPWPRMIGIFVLINFGLMLLAGLATFKRLPLQVKVGVFLAGLLLLWVAMGVARHLWRKPTRKRLNLIAFGFSFIFTLILALDKYWLPAGVTHSDMAAPMIVALMLFVMTVSGWWFLVIYRVEQIEARLRELDEQERNLKLARRLATAQIQPHFLFNTLASLQHWVDTQDPRAGSTLRSFTAYLRATLPMFEHELLSLGEELQMVRCYLEVMKARLGERLQWTVEMEMAPDAAPEQALAALQLPPGLLLTLAENAIGHGIEPALSGGRIAVRARLAGTHIWLEVEDDGAGLDAEPQEQVGLSNARARLQQRFGAQAKLRLLPRASGAPGVLAQIELPRSALAP